MEQLWRQLEINCKSLSENFRCKPPKLETFSIINKTILAYFMKIFDELLASFIFRLNFYKFASFREMHVS